jgi:hypothetical protein
MIDYDANRENNARSSVFDDKVWLLTRISASIAERDAFAEKVAILVQDNELCVDDAREKVFSDYYLGEK